jgi:RNA polymerase sigma-70 factor (ECF subfamily)
MTCIEYKDLSEESLIKLCKKEDCLAFDELTNRNKIALFHYIVGKTKDESTANDILQITLIKAWKNVKKFQGRAKILSWLTKIAFNAYYDYYKKKKREVSIEETSKDSPSFNEVRLGLVVEDPFKESKIKDLSEKIKKTIDSLSKEHKEVLELRELYGLDCKEISKKINCPYPTVCTRLFYARKKAKLVLKRLLKNG